MSQNTSISHLALWLAVSGCAIGAPPGFSNGNSWTAPLVDPLEDGSLLAPVYVDDHGPYLFLLDADAAVSIVDRAVVTAAGVPAFSGRRLDDWDDVTHPTFYAEIPNIRLGDLDASLRRVAVSDDHTFDADGHRIYGIIGRDIIADSIVFGFDRERGIVWMTTQEAFAPPAGAQVLPFFKGNSEVTPRAVIHKLVHAQIGGHSYDLHLDLSHVPNQLRTRHWSEAALATTPVRSDIIDDLGTHRAATIVGVADHVAVGPIVRDHVEFVPFMDRRWWWSDGELEGTLGLDFFRPFAVAADWHHERFYLTPRTPSPETLQSRLARWGEFARCRHVGCAQLSVTAGPTGTATVVRDTEAEHLDLELLVAATLPSGETLPRLQVNLPRGVASLEAPIDPRYASASFEVIDLSPFPRSCEQPGGCVLPD